MSLIKGLWSKIAGGASAPAEDKPGETVEYNGYRITPTPFADGGQFQTAGRIEKDVDGVTREHRFIRAEKLPSREDAENFAVMKARQIIDQQGDRIFRD
jgi:hypothetical protein